MQKKDDKDQEELPIDLTFCYQANVIFFEEQKKIDYVGTFTVSNSKSAMSKMIGLQIDNKLKNQQELEVKFENKIAEKLTKVNLVEEEEINRLNQQIKECAEELKSSTNSICKTLAENPDIPKNLIKAKSDQKLIMKHLAKIQEDLVNGKLLNFDEMIRQFDEKRINIDNLRKNEMKSFRDLRLLNENLNKEEADYTKDQAEMNKILFQRKNDLAKTKLEEKIFIDYQTNNIYALKDLVKKNFEDDERKMHEEIKKKNQLRENINELNIIVNDYLKDQKDFYEKDKAKWDALKKEKETENNRTINDLTKHNDNKRKGIEDLSKKIENYREANNHLEKVASELNSFVYNTIHPSFNPDTLKLPQIKNVPEQKSVI